MTRLRLVLLVRFLLPLLLVPAGCATSPATGTRSVTAFMSPEQERQIGAEEHPKLVKEMGGAYLDPALQAYVAEIGLKLASVGNAPDAPYTFTIVDSEDVNAYALPGGYVHVTRGLLALANSEAELASVLAHEIGHVVAHHSARRYTRSIIAERAAAVPGVGVAEVPAGVGDLAALGTETALQGYSREQELEADMLAVRFLADAGYDPRALATFLEVLNAYSGLQAVLADRRAAATDCPNIMASHPRNADRIAHAIGFAVQTPVPDARARRDAYLARIDGLIYGDSPEQGLRIGRDFYHRDLHFTFRVPPGFTMVNRPRQLVARGPQGALIAFDMVSPQDMRDLVRYVGRDWGGGLDLTHVEPIAVGGMDGATGTARTQTGGGLADIRLVALQADPGRVYRFIFLTPPPLTEQLGADLMRTIDSFRRLTEAEAAAITPLRIRVATVRRGDTPRSLAAAMPFTDSPLERFLVLNQIDPGTPLEPGRKVKVVTRDASP